MHGNGAGFGVHNDARRAKHWAFASFARLVPAYEPPDGRLAGRWRRDASRTSTGLADGFGVGNRRAAMRIHPGKWFPRIRKRGIRRVKHSTIYVPCALPMQTDRKIAPAGEARSHAVPTVGPHRLEMKDLDWMGQEMSMPG